MAATSSMRPEPDWAAIDWPAQQHWVRAGDTVLNVCEIGSGDPVLLVHGHGGRWQNWLENIVALAGGGRRVIAPDLPGFGASPLPPWPVTIERYAEIMASLLGALDAPRAAVVGHSMGGAVAAELAVGWPDRVRALALVAPVGLARRVAGLPVSLLTHDRAATLVERLLPRAAVPFERARRLAARPRLRRLALAGTMRHGDRASPQLAIEFIAGSGAPAGATALVASPAIPARLHELSLPALLVWGAQDRLIAPSCAERWRELISGARLEIVPDTGHTPHAERPEWFNERLAGFLSETRGR